MALTNPGNGTNFINEMWNTSLSPFTNLFERFVGNGNIFFLFPLIIITMGLWIKTEHNGPVVAVFMIGSGALLGVGTLAMGIPDLPILFGIFAAFGLVPLFSSIFFGGN